MNRAEVTLFPTDQELREWLLRQQPVFELTKEEADLLMGYLEGSGFALGVTSEDVMVRKDILAEDGEIVPYHIHEIIDLVCEWNYEFLQGEETKLEKMTLPKGKAELEKQIQSLQEDEVILDRLFDRTPYGKELEEKAVLIASEILREYKQSGRINLSAIEVGRMR